MIYIIREPGKTGGTRFERSEDAIDACIDWYNSTGIRCEIYVEWHPTEPTYSAVYSAEARWWMDHQFNLHPQPFV